MLFVRPLIPKFAGSNPAEAVGFLQGDKNPQHAFLQKICGMWKNPECISQAPFGHHFSPIVPPLAARGLPRVVDARGTWQPKQEVKKDGESYNKSHWLQCFQGANRGTGTPNQNLKKLKCFSLSIRNDYIHQHCGVMYCLHIRGLAASFSPRLDWYSVKTDVTIQQSRQRSTTEDADVYRRRCGDLKSWIKQVNWVTEKSFILLPKFVIQFSVMLYGLYSQDLYLIEACVHLVILNFTVDSLVHDRSLERENAIC